MEGEEASRKVLGQFKICKLLKIKNRKKRIKNRHFLIEKYFIQVGDDAKQTYFLLNKCMYCIYVA